MQSLHSEYLNLTQLIDQQCSDLKNRGCSLKNIYLGENEYKLLRLELSGRHKFAVIYPKIPEPPFEMICGLRVYLVYNRSHMEITWASPFDGASR